MVIKSIKALHEYIKHKPTKLLLLRQLGILKLPGEKRCTVMIGRPLATMYCLFLHRERNSGLF
jgi:hypothetical protein